jgi:hypothetical protein
MYDNNNNAICISLSFILSFFSAHRQIRIRSSKGFLAVKVLYKWNTAVKIQFRLRQPRETIWAIQFWSIKYELWGILHQWRQTRATQSFSLFSTIQCSIISVSWLAAFQMIEERLINIIIDLRIIFISIYVHSSMLKMNTHCVVI